MSESNDQPAEDSDSGRQSAEASVGFAGEPSGSLDTRDLAAAPMEAPSHEDLNAREEKLSGPRKPMGPTGRNDDPPETIPEENES